MKRNIMLTMRYDGSRFHGWQIQENADTVQQEICSALKRILGEEITVNGCSRTDTGVHADMFCCNFRTETDKENDKIIKGLNAVLPSSIGIYDIKDMPYDFHARYDCKGKEYIYKIWNSKYKNPFLTEYALHYPYELDVELLDRQAKDFVGTYDFSAFCAAGSSVQSTVRTITECSVTRQGELVTFSVKGDGFLYNMVRIMVGTLLDINSGKIPEGSIGEIISSCDRSRAGITAKARGLYLNRVYY